MDATNINLIPRLHPSCAKAKISVSSLSLKLEQIFQALLITQNTRTAQDKHIRSTSSWLLPRVSKAVPPPLLRSSKLKAYIWRPPGFLSEWHNTSGINIPRYLIHVLTAINGVLSDKISWILQQELSQLLTAWPYGPRTTLAYLITEAISSLSTAFCRHLLTFFSRRSFSTSSNHHHPGLPLLLLPSGSLSIIFLTLLTWSILTTCPTYSNLLFHNICCYV